MMLSSNQKGYCIHLYHNAPKSSHNSEGYIGCNNKNMGKNSESNTSIPEFLTFGDYNSLQIKVANSFQDYHNLSHLTNDCACEEKSILLYPLDLKTDPYLFYNEVEGHGTIAAKENLTEGFWVFLCLLSQIRLWKKQVIIPN